MVKPPGVFWLSVSSHGVQYPRPGDEREEPDAMGEALVAHDEFVLDKTLWQLWYQFQAGVRVLVTTDFCFSLGATRRFSRLLQLQQRLAEALATGRKIGGGELLQVLPGGEAMGLTLNLTKWIGESFQNVGRSVSPTAVCALLAEVLAPAAVESPAPATVRALEFEVGVEEIRRHRSLYESTIEAPEPRADPQCSVMQLTGGSADEEVDDGRPDANGVINGAWTKAVLELWQTSSSHRDLQEKCRARLEPRQHPGIFHATTTNQMWESEPPFTIR
jgi:hypothetical protein